MKASRNLLTFHKELWKSEFLQNLFLNTLFIPSLLWVKVISAVNESRYTIAHFFLKSYKFAMHWFFYLCSYTNLLKSGSIRVLLNYMPEMFSGIKIDVPETNTMACIPEYISNCSCHGHVLIGENCTWMLSRHCWKKGFKEPRKWFNSLIKYQCSTKIIVCLWWLVPTNGEKGILNLLVWKVVSNDTASPKHA